jgi:hypothetical protein
MLARTWSAAIQGVDALTIEIEINATGLGNETKVMVVGLPDAAVRESRERVWSALSTSMVAPPPGYTAINLSPAEIELKAVYRSGDGTPCCKHVYGTCRSRSQAGPIPGRGVDLCQARGPGSSAALG